MWYSQSMSESIWRTAKDMVFHRPEKRTLSGGSQLREFAGLGGTALGMLFHRQDERHADKNPGAAAAFNSRLISGQARVTSQAQMTENKRLSEASAQQRAQESKPALPQNQPKRPALPGS